VYSRKYFSKEQEVFNSKTVQHCGSIVSKLHQLSQQTITWDIHTLHRQLKGQQQRNFFEK
jgi:hypothetical protein